MTKAFRREPVILESDGRGGESTRALLAALAAGDLDRADAAAADLGQVESLDASIQKALADLHVRRQRWARAAETLALIQPRHVGIEMQWRLARNFADLQQNRPGVYRTLTTASQSASNCQPTISSSGAATLVQTLPGGQPVVLTPGGDPTVATPQIVEGLRDDLKRGRCLVLCGVGDGYLLTHLASHPVELQLGQQQCVHLIEPHTEVVMAAMMLHDWSGPTGPIQDRRFQWWVGETWMDDLHSALENDPYLPLPERPVRMSIAPDELDAMLRNVIAAVQESERKVAGRVKRRYASLDAAKLAMLFGDEPPRPPRVLLLTTRFSTVLQHSTRDLASAFEQAGWATRMPIEPSPYHRNSQRNLLRHLADFQPDLIVQIDHLRHEHGELFPPQVPFVCWIQDDLSNLTKRQAGAAVGPRDFVLTTSQAVYVNDFGYPQRQCIYMPKATRLPDLDGLPRVEAPDVVYVSNASGTVSSLVDQLSDEHASQPEVVQLIRAVSQYLSDGYARGECFYTAAEVQRVLLEQAGCLGMRMIDGGAFATKLAARLFATVNNALYRQQSIEWAVWACRSCGLSLGLYGAGWDAHPGFAEFARGPVQYGPDLEALTRSAKVNLQIVPYSCLHQRVFDGLAAGGFFLIREHPVDRLTLQFNAIMQGILQQGLGPESTDDLRRLLRGASLEAFEDWLAQREQVVEHCGTDPVANFLAARREGRDFLYSVLPGHDEVAFNSPDRLVRLIDAFKDDDAARGRVVGMQRDFVKRHYTYSAGLERALARMTNLLAAEISETPNRADCAAGRTTRCA